MSRRTRLTLLPATLALALTLGCTEVRETAPGSDALAPPDPCGACHGSADAPAGFLDLRGVEDLAHRAHLAPSLMAPLGCEACHEVPAAVDDPGHVDDGLPAEVTFSDAALLGDRPPSWDPAAGTCSSTYCHGAGMDGGAVDAPSWALTDGSQRACGACHGFPPAAPHPDAADCASCHAVFDEAGQLDPARHIDGAISASVTGSCAACHGFPPPAPHPDRADCSTCHPVFGEDGQLDPEVHRNGTVDLDEELVGSCSFCHDFPPAPPHPSRADCSTCHPIFTDDGEIDPQVHGNGATDVHEELGCALCHGDEASPAPPMGLEGETSGDEPAVGAHRVHVLGDQLQTPVACSECHRVPEAWSDPGHMDDTDGEAELVFGPLATADGVLTPVYEDGRCASVYCHGAGLDGGTVATPAWTQVFTPEEACGGCHGLPPGGEHPQVSACGMCHAAFDDQGQLMPEAHVDGALATQGLVSCTMCHGFPPVAPHPARQDCATCHAAFDEQGLLDHQEHKDGEVDVIASLGCSECHGDESSSAPPVDLSGDSEISSPGVGVHRAHLSGGESGAPVACTECHVVPTTWSDDGHMDDDDGAAEVVFGPLATAEGSLSPVYEGGACSSVYCHGASLDGAGVASPDWTTPFVEGEACGACHGMPPGGGHPQVDDCASCHVVYDEQGALDRALHVDGALALGSLSCDACHGFPPAAPHPASEDCAACHDAFDDQGELDEAKHRDGAVNVLEVLGCSACHGDESSPAPAVGAHAAHLSGGRVKVFVACTDCHVVPQAWSDAGHIDDGVAEVTFGPLATGDGDLSPSYVDGTCSNTYCHGADLDGGTNTAPSWTQTIPDLCGTCHGLPPGGDHPNMDSCGMCHGSTYGADGLKDDGFHLDGDT